MDWQTITDEQLADLIRRSAPPGNNNLETVWQDVLAQAGKARSARGRMTALLRAAAADVVHAVAGRRRIWLPAASIVCALVVAAGYWRVGSGHNQAANPIGRENAVYRHYLSFTPHLPLYTAGETLQSVQLSSYAYGGAMIFSALYQDFSIQIMPYAARSPWRYGPTPISVTADGAPATYWPTAQVLDFVKNGVQYLVSGHSASGSPLSMNAVIRIADSLNGNVAIAPQAIHLRLLGVALVRRTVGHLAPIPRYVPHGYRLAQLFADMEVAGGVRRISSVTAVYDGTINRNVQSGMRNQPIQIREILDPALSAARWRATRSEGRWLTLSGRKVYAHQNGLEGVSFTWFGAADKTEFQAVFNFWSSRTFPVAQRVVASLAAAR
ncbi:MAG: hypothetical protein ACYCVB_03585 [Bacilli bacterium]